MLRYTAHRNVRLGIRGFGKLMCVLIYCLLILYFFKILLHNFFLDLLRFLLWNAKALSWHYLWTSDVLVSLFKDRLLIIYCNCWIFSAAVKPLKFWSCPPVNLDFFFFDSVINLVVILLIIVYVASICKNNLKNQSNISQY